MKEWKFNANIFFTSTKENTASKQVCCFTINSVCKVMDDRFVVSKDGVVINEHHNILHVLTCFFYDENCI